MPSANTRKVTVHYRRLTRDGDRFLPNHSLSDAVGEALQSAQFAPDWQRRVMASADGSGANQFVNHSVADVGATFGDLCSFTNDEMQAVISTGQIETPSVSVADVRAPDGRDYLHGMAYWLLVGNHCYVIQHASVRTKALESYLTWLLRKARLLEDDQRVTLQAQFALQGEEMENVGDVMGIEIGGIVADDGSASRPNAAVSSRALEVRRALEERVAPVNSGMDWLKSAFGPTEVDRIMSQVPDGAALKVTLRVGYIALQRSLSRQAIDDLAVAARNFDDGEVRIRGRKGDILGNEARLHMPVNVKLVRDHGHLLDFEDTHEQLMTVHDKFVEDGRVSP